MDRISALFCELVRGCRQTECAYQCRAQKLRVLIRGRLLIEATRALHRAACPASTPVVLYGLGDSGLFPWEQTAGFEDDPGWLDVCSVTLPAGISRKQVLLIQRRFARIVLLSVSTVEELRAALALSDVVKGIVVPGSRRVPLELVVAEAHRFGVVVMRSVERSREDYLSLDDFAQLISWGTLRARETCQANLMVGRAEQVEGALLVWCSLCWGSVDEEVIRIPYRDGLYGRLDEEGTEVLSQVVARCDECGDFRRGERWEWIT